LVHLHLRTRLALSTAAGILLLFGFLRARDAFTHHPTSTLRVSLSTAQLLADGHDTATLKADAGAIHVSILEGAHRASIEQVSGNEARIRAGILPGPVKLRIEAPGYLPATAELSTTIQTTDRNEDGTPDFLRLDDDHDRQAFRRWFTFLAEAQYFQKPELRPKEINDCAALIRYAYRETLRKHDGAWSAGAELPLISALDSIAKYEYPYTPLGTALFRVRSGPFRSSDLADGTFAQFADVQTLHRLNTHFVTRDLSRAEPGDLLFFRQLSDHMPFHSMIFIGRSQIEHGASEYVLYHTGPTGSEPGEIRRLTVEQLLRYPEPQWRPISINASFLGIYRWNILKKDSL